MWSAPQSATRLSRTVICSMNSYFEKSTRTVPVPGPMPLDGIRVVSLALNVPGPVAASRLRALGAHVDKIEPPNGDPLMALCPVWYERLHAGVEVHRFDLKAAPARAELDDLLA